LIIHDIMYYDLALSVFRKGMSTSNCAKIE
jgi:hypothetical protein